MKKFTQIVEGETIEEFKQAVAELHSMVCLPLPSSAGADVGYAEEGNKAHEDALKSLGSKKAKKTKPVEVEAVDADEEVEEKSVISPSKLKKEAAKKVEEEPEPVEEVFSEEDVLGEAPEAQEEEVLDFDKIREITQEIVDQYDMDKARQLCQKFGARTVSALKQADYAKFAAEARKLLK